MKMFWVIIALITLIILLLMGYTQSASTNFELDQFSNLAYLSLLGLVSISALLSSGMKLTHMLRNAMIWASIILSFMFIYNVRYELQDFASKMTGGLIPGSPIDRYNENGTTVTLNRMLNGHFESPAYVNDAPINFMIDTGATNITLSYEAAQKIGIDVKNLKFTIPVTTANGEAKSSSVVLKSIQIGSIKRENVSAFVALPGALTGNLLGMNFLDRLSGYSVRGDRMILVD